MKSVRNLAVAAVGATALLVAACSSSSSTATSAPSSASSAASTSAAEASTSSVASAAASSASTSTATSASSTALTGTVTIFAAASLKKGFDLERTAFLAANPGVKVPAIDYDGSATLVTQITAGAPADVFASADTKNMAKLTKAGLITGTPPLFATNTLEIAVSPGNPKKIATLADLAKSGVETVLCAAAQPCGAAAIKALAAGKVTVKPVSLEQSVTAVLTKVESGDADAGLVYKTDVLSAGSKVTGVNFTEASDAVNQYPIGVLKDTKNTAAANAFVAFVTSPAGEKILQDIGFGAP